LRAISRSYITRVLDRTNRIRSSSSIGHHIHLTQEHVKLYSAKPSTHETPDSPAANTLQRAAAIVVQRRSSGPRLGRRAIYADRDRMTSNSDRVHPPIRECDIADSPCTLESPNGSVKVDRGSSAPCATSLTPRTPSYGVRDNHRPRPHREIANWFSRRFNPRGPSFALAITLTLTKPMPRTSNWRRIIDGVQSE